MSEKLTEKLPEGERPPVRIVGPAPEIVKEHVAETIQGRFGGDHFSQLSEDQLVGLAEASRPKEEYELKFIEKSNEILDNLLRDHGLTPFSTPARNIHMVDGNYFGKMGGRKNWKALHNNERQWVLVNDNKMENPIEMAESVFHELVHNKGFLTREAFADRKNKNAYTDGSFRNGLMIHVTAKKSREKTGYFEMYRGLNEALVEETTKRYVGDVIEHASDDPAIKELVEFQSTEEAGKVIDAVCNKERIDSDEILYVQKNKGGDYLWRSYSYPRQRNVLNYIVSSAAEEGMVSSPQEAMNLFFKAYFTGNIKELAALVDKTFGPGTYRLLKHMDDDNSASSILDDLQKKRRLKKVKKDVK